ncbi:conserved hypothetical protein [Neospora caninum Liverpool]|uniref:Uncharacterized protein n=1 Tax=Neospora caninum (strain Liverpool) TaxID=572307 RepID=F0VC60_NEOCL|nr:conserved hypothetical protein [Neospora caninum Liverpool]CBZ51194.1 conserved hypothetical protein [Neospora caninum Liverpool]|eukprot:XP_003881227.1 conserved hypothetical protein [Neospora caninum Liverpool]
MASAQADEGTGGSLRFFKSGASAVSTASRLLSTETTASDFSRSRRPTSRLPTDPFVSPENGEAPEALSLGSPSFSKTRPLSTERASTMRAVAPSLSRSNSQTASLRTRSIYEEERFSSFQFSKTADDSGAGYSGFLHRMPFASAEGNAGSTAGRAGTPSFPRLDAEKDTLSDANNSPSSLARSVASGSHSKGGAAVLASSLLQRSRNERLTGMRACAESRSYGSEAAVAGEKSSRFLTSLYEPEREGARARQSGDRFEGGTRLESFALSTRRRGSDLVSTGRLHESKAQASSVPTFLRTSHEATSPVSGRGVYTEQSRRLEEREQDFGRDKPSFLSASSSPRQQPDPLRSSSQSSSQNGVVLLSSRNLHVPAERGSFRSERLVYTSYGGGKGAVSHRESEENVKAAPSASRHSGLSDGRLDLGDSSERSLHRRGPARDSSGARVGDTHLTNRAFLVNGDSPKSAAADPHARLGDAAPERSSFPRGSLYESRREGEGLSTSQFAERGRSGDLVGEDGTRGEPVERRWGSSLGLSGARSTGRDGETLHAVTRRHHGTEREADGGDTLFSPLGSGRDQSLVSPRRGDKPTHFSDFGLGASRRERESAAGVSSPLASRPELLATSRPPFLPPASFATSDGSTDRALAASVRPKFLGDSGHKSELLASSRDGESPSGRGAARGSTERGLSLLQSSAVSRRSGFLPATPADETDREREERLPAAGPKTAGLEGDTQSGECESTKGSGFRSARVGATEMPGGGRVSDGSRVRSNSALLRLSQGLHPPLPRVQRVGEEVFQREEDGVERCGVRQKRDREVLFSRSSSTLRATVPTRPVLRSLSQPAPGAGSAVSPSSCRAKDIPSDVAKASFQKEGGDRNDLFQLYEKNKSTTPGSASSASSLGDGARQDTFLDSREEAEEKNRESKDARLLGLAESGVDSGATSLARFAMATGGAESLGGASARAPHLSTHQPSSLAAEEGGSGARSPRASLEHEQTGGLSQRSSRNSQLSARIENAGFAKPSAGGAYPGLLFSGTSAVTGKPDAGGKGSTVCVCQASRYMSRQKAHYEQQLRRVEEERDQQQQRRRLLAEQEAQVALLQSQVQRQREGVMEEEKHLREMRAQVTAEREAMEARWQQFEKQRQELLEKKEKWRKTAQQKRDELQAFSLRIRADKKELDEKKKEVARDTTSLKDKIESREQDSLNRQRVELEELRFSLDREKAELGARISATEDERRRLKKKEEELARREAKAQSKEEELRREEMEVERRTQAVALKAEEEEQKELDRVSLWRQKNEELDRRARLLHEQETEMDARAHALRRQETERKREDEREKKKLQQLQDAFLEEKKNFAREKGRVEAQLDEEKKRLAEEKKALEHDRKNFEAYVEEERAKWGEERRAANAEFDKKKKEWEEERSSGEAELVAAQERIHKTEKELEEEEKRRSEETKKLTQELLDEKERIARQLADQEQMRAMLSAEREKLQEERARSGEALQRERERLEEENGRETQRLEAQRERLKEKEAEIDAEKERWQAEREAVESRLREEEEKVEQGRRLLSQQREAFEEDVRKEREQFRAEQEAVLADFRSQCQAAERELGEQKAQQEEMIEEERQRLLQSEERQQEAYAEQINQLRSLEEEVHQQKLHHQQDVSRHLEREEALFERERRVREDEQSVQDEKQKLSKEKQGVARQRRQLEEAQTHQKQVEAALKKEREEIEKKVESLRDQVLRVAEVDEKFARLREAEDALEIERAAFEAEKESFKREKELIDAQVGAWRRKLSQREQEVGRREREASTRLRDLETQEKVHKVRMEEEGLANKSVKQASGSVNTRRGVSVSGAATGRAPSVSRPLSRGNERNGEATEQREGELGKDREGKKATSNSRTRSLSTERRTRGVGAGLAGGPKPAAGRRTLTPVDQASRGLSKWGRNGAGREGEAGKEGEAKRANGEAGRTGKRPGAAVCAESVDECEGEDTGAFTRERATSAASLQDKPGKDGKDLSGKRDGVSRLLPALRGGQKSFAPPGSSTRASSVGRDGGEEQDKETDRRPTRGIGASARKPPVHALLSSADRSDGLPQKNLPFPLASPAGASPSRKGLTEGQTVASSGRVEEGEDAREEKGGNAKKMGMSRRAGFFPLLLLFFSAAIFARETFPRVSHLAASRQSCSTSALSHPFPSSSPVRDSPDKTPGHSSSSVYSPYTFRFSSFLKQQASSMGEGEDDDAKRTNPSSETQCPGVSSFSSEEKSSAPSAGRQFSSLGPSLPPVTASRTEREEGKQARVSPSVSSRSSFCVSPLSLNGLSTGTFDRSRVERSQEAPQGDGEASSPRRGTAVGTAGHEETQRNVLMDREERTASSSFFSSCSLAHPVSSRISASATLREERSRSSVERSREDEERRRDEEHREVSVAGGSSASLSTQTRAKETVYRREGTGGPAKRGRGDRDDSGSFLSGKGDGFSGRETLSRTPVMSPSGVLGKERSVLSRTGSTEQETEERGNSQPLRHELQSPRSRQAWKDRLAAACAPRRSIPLTEAEDDKEARSPFLDSLRSETNRNRKEGESPFSSTSVYRRREDDEGKIRGTMFRKSGEAGSSGSFNARESVISHLSAFNPAEDNSDYGSGENSLSGLGSSSRISTGRGKTSRAGR